MGQYVDDMFSIIDGLNESEKEELSSLDIKYHTLNIPYILETICRKARKIKDVNVRNCGLKNDDIKKIFPRMTISGDNFVFGYRYFPV